METEERKLVTIREINNIEPIIGADKIEKLTIDGWQVVSGKGNFITGDKCIFFEVDSFIPESLIQNNMQFLAKDMITWKGQKGARIRTVKLRGQISAGLAVPISTFGEIVNFNNAKYFKFNETLELNKQDENLQDSQSNKSEDLCRENS